MTDRTTVTWTITDADGNPLANRMVYATLVAGVGGGSVDSLVVAERATARTDADGIATFSSGRTRRSTPTAPTTRSPPTSPGRRSCATSRSRPRPRRWRSRILDAVEPVTVGGSCPPRRLVTRSTCCASVLMALLQSGGTERWRCVAVRRRPEGARDRGRWGWHRGVRSDHVHPMPSPSDGAPPHDPHLGRPGPLRGPVRVPRQRTAPSLVPGTDVQAYDADLAAIAALATTTYGRSPLTRTDSPVWAHQQIAWLQWKAYGGGDGAPIRTQTFTHHDERGRSTTTLGHWIQTGHADRPWEPDVDDHPRQEPSLDVLASRHPDDVVGTVNMYAPSWWRTTSPRSAASP